MPRLFEFADSEISRVETTGDTVVLRFAAALLHDTASDAAAATQGCSHEHWGYSNALHLRLQGAVVQGDTAHGVADGVGRLASGQLRMGDARHTRLPVPCDYTATDDGLLRLELQLAHGAWLHIDAQRLQCAEAADAQFVEVFQC